MHEQSRETDLLTLGRALRRLRLDADLTQEQLGERLGMHAGYISRLERGHRGVQWLTVQRFLSALDSDLRQLADAIELVQAE